MDLASYLMFLLLIVSVSFSILVVLVKLKLRGKLIAFIIGKNRELSFVISRKTASGKLADVKTSEGKEMYRIDSECTMLTRYPFAPIPILQSEVPCAIYQEDDPNPLSPSTFQLTKGLTSKELAKAMDEHIIDEIVKATEDNKKKQFVNWIAPVVTVVCMVVILGMVYAMNSDLQNMAVQVEKIYDYTKAAGGV